MPDVDRVFWRAVTGADFFTIERSRDAAPTGGGGQSYVSVSFRGLTHEELGEFLGVDPPGAIGTTRPTVVLDDVAVAREPAVRAPLRFAPRYQPPHTDDRYRIATQNRQFQQRHPAWTARFGFPTAPDDVTGTDDPRMPDLSLLKLWVARTVDGGYAAGFVNAAAVPAALARIPGLGVLFEEYDVQRSAGVVPIAPGSLTLAQLAAATAFGGAALAGTAPEVLEAVDATRTAAGRRPSGQGRRQDADARRAIELRAMRVAAEALLAEGWRVEDVSLFRSYDLHCTRRHEQLRVEVKGTTGDGSSVLLTPNEVSHAREHYPQVALYVVSRVVLQEVAGAVTATGGVLEVVRPWDVDAHGELVPTGFEYRRAKR